MIRKTLCRAECDLQVIAAGIGVHIQHFACKVEAEGLFALHGLGVHLPHRCTSSRFCSRVIWFALVAGSMPQRATMTGCILDGSSFTSAPCAAWFARRAKSRVMRS